MTLRSYVRLMRLEDGLRAHQFYFRAARTAVEVYLRLHDRPLKDAKVETEDNTGSINLFLFYFFFQILQLHVFIVRIYVIQLF